MRAQLLEHVADGLARIQPFDRAQKVEGRFPSGDFSFHGKDAHKWQAFVDYASGVQPAVAREGTP